MAKYKNTEIKSCPVCGWTATKYKNVETCKCMNGDCILYDYPCDIADWNVRPLGEISEIKADNKVMLDAIKYIKENSYPGLAVRESILLSRIFKLTRKILRHKGKK